MYHFFRLYKAVEASQDVLKGPRAKCKQTVSNKHSTQSSRSLKLDHLLKDQMWDDFKEMKNRLSYFFSLRSYQCTMYLRLRVEMNL